MARHESLIEICWFWFPSTSKNFFLLVKTYFIFAKKKVLKIYSLVVNFRQVFFKTRKKSLEAPFFSLLFRPLLLFEWLSNLRYWKFCNSHWQVRWTLVWPEKAIFTLIVLFFSLLFHFSIAQVPMSFDGSKKNTK